MEVSMKVHVLEIPLVFDILCKFLSNKDLLTCRLLNHFWNSSIIKTLNERGAENGPTIKINNAKSKGRDISTHLKFLADRKYKSIQWIRAYKLEVFMDGNTPVQSVPDFMKDCMNLVKSYGQRVVSMDLKYQDLSDVLLLEVLRKPHFETFFAHLKEIRFAVARLRHCFEVDPQFLIQTINSMTNLTRLTLCYTRMFQHFLPKDPCDYYCLTLSKLNRLSKLEHLTISLNYLSFFFIKDLDTMSSLKFLRIFVQGEADFNPALFEFLQAKCPALKELYLIRLGALASWSNSPEDFPDNESDWLKQTRQLEIKFPNVRVKYSLDLQRLISQRVNAEMENLLKLSKKTIPKFMDLYRSANYPRHALTCSALRNFDVLVDKYPEMKNNLELLTLNEDWQKDGLFLMKNGRSYYFDSLESQPFDRVKKLLLQIDYSKEVVFRAVNDQFKPMMNDVFWLRNLVITDQTGTATNLIPRDVVAKLPIHPLPEGWTMRSLTLDDISEINEKLLREGGDNIGYVENSIKYKESLALFDENGKLQAWIFEVDVGMVGSLGTTDRHKRKGAASAIGVKIAQNLISQHDMDFVFNTVHGDEGGEGFARKFNATTIGTVTWMAVNKKVHSKMSQMGMFQIFYPKL